MIRYFGQSLISDQVVLHICENTMGFKNPIHLTRAQEPQTCWLTLYKYGNAPSALFTLSLLLVCFFNLLN